LDIKDFKIQDTAIIKTQFEGVNIDLKYISKSEYRRRLKAAEVTTWVNHQKVTEPSTEKLFDGFLDVIVSWDMTAAQFCSICGAETEQDPTMEIPCNDEFKKFMFEYAYGFEDFIISNITSYQEVKKN
jgi:hypothetical protein